MPTLLIVDDEPNIRASLKGALGREGYQVDDAGGVAEARAKLREAYDLVLLDVWLPDGSGLDLLAEIRGQAPETTVLMMSGHATIDAAVQATRLGAFDFLEKPVALERLLVLLRNAATTRSLQAENRRLQEPWAVPLVGRSPAIAKLLEQIALAGPSPARVLIRGEHGAGKELVARALHASSPRRAMPFVAVNCSAIPEELFESELFGHERGAFTGATQARRGRFEEAQGGTLLLDEVGDLSARAQTKLLRVLQENELTRVGGSRAIRVDVRTVAATNRDLAAAVAAGAYREDLYFRLAVIPIDVPPLRERSGDVPLLVEHFAARLARETGRRPQAFSAAALEALRRHPFPGNVRELRNLVERLLIMNPGMTLGAAEVRAVLPGGGAPGAAPSESPQPLAEAVRDFERRQVEAALAAEGGHMTRAAARLGLERSHLYKKMRQLGLRAEE
ncbi:MAG: sigma-54-dependent Fis family transcriptional regulator [Candidatus Eisenbacteria bacterium]|nr:sigma-54-dependent Fis family transcriptional regulator [Candidatus Eisenbacteria bacterium]